MKKITYYVFHHINYSANGLLNFSLRMNLEGLFIILSEIGP